MPASAPDKVIIIGAGLAGLTAAYRLSQKNYNIEIYEARSRVGGRVHTALIENHEGEYSFAELGGQNIHDGGEAKNFLALSAELGLQTIEEYRDFSRLFHDGQQFHNPQQILQQCNFNTQKLRKQLASLAEKSANMAEILAKLFSNNPPLKRICTFMLTAYEGAPPYLLSPIHNIETLEYLLLGGISQAHQINENDQKIHMMSLQGGNAILPNKIADILGNKLYLNKILQQVSRTHDRKIALTFADGTSTFCDKLILAIPTPIYQDITFLDDIIPAEQLNLIRQVAYGSNAKILLPIKFQNLTHQTVASTHLAGFFNCDQKLLNMYFINDEGKYFFKNEYYTEQLAILTQGFNNATFTSAEPVIAEDLQYCKYSAPVAKSWVSDPFAKGSYSYYNAELGELFDQTEQYKNIQVKTIFAPVNDQIFFAGEHATILSEIGTMEAAVESGERIASCL